MNNKINITGEKQMTIFKQHDIVRIKNAIQGVTFWTIDEILSNGKIHLVNGPFYMEENPENLILMASQETFLPRQTKEQRKTQTLRSGDLVFIQPNTVAVVVNAAQKTDNSVDLTDGQNTYTEVKEVVRLLVPFVYRLDRACFIERGDIVKLLKRNTFGKVDFVHDEEDVSHPYRISLGTNSDVVYLKSEDIVLVAKAKQSMPIPLTHVTTSILAVGDLVLNKENVIYEITENENDSSVTCCVGSITFDAPKHELSLILEAKDRLDITTIDDDDSKEKELHQQIIALKEAHKKDLQELRSRHIQSAKDIEKLCQEKQDAIHALKKEYDKERNALQEELHSLEMINRSLQGEIDKYKDVNRYQQVIIDNQQEIIARLDS